MGCPRRQAHTRNQISRGDTASVFGCRVPLDRGGRRGWLAPNSPLFSQELDEWVEDSAVHVSQRQSNWFWIRDKKMKTCLVKLTCHTAGCSAQVDDPTAPSLKAGLFSFIFLPIANFLIVCLHLLWKGNHMWYQHLHLLDFAYTWISMLRIWQLRQKRK